MAIGVNKVFILGNIGMEPDVRYSSNGTAVAKISVATSESWKDKTTGEKQTHTEWHKITLHNRLAEVAKEYMHKGTKVYVEGYLRTTKWKDKTGNENQKTEILATSVQLLGGPANSQQENNQTNRVVSSGNLQAAQLPGFDDDDLPF